MTCRTASRESLPDRLYRLGKLTKDQHIACAEIRRAWECRMLTPGIVEWATAEQDVPVIGAIRTSRLNLTILLLVVRAPIAQVAGWYRLRDPLVLEHLKASLDAYIAKEVEISNRLAKMERAAHDSIIGPLESGI